MVVGIQVFDKAFFPRSNRCYDNLEIAFAISMVTIVKEINTFIKIMQFVNLKYLWKKWSKADKK